MLNMISDSMQAHLAVQPAKIVYMGETFKERMKRIRIRAGYRSQGPASEAIGCERGTVSMWEAPSSAVQSVSSDLLFAVARAYRVDPEWINNLSSMEDGFPWGEFEPPAPPVLADETGKREHVRVNLLDGEANMGADGRINDDYPEVIRSMDFTAAYIRAVVGFVPPPGRLVLVTGRGDSMLPTIQPGEALMVDTGVTSYDNDGVYLVNLGNGQQVKRLVDHGDSVHVHSDNPAYPSFPLPRGAIVGGKVYLRNRIDRFN